MENLAMDSNISSYLTGKFYYYSKIIKYQFLRLAYHIRFANTVNVGDVKLHKHSHREVCNHIKFCFNYHRYIYKIDPINITWAVKR